MFVKISKNYVPVISLFLCIVFVSFICIINFPFLHNMEADVNIWNVKTYVILEGKHHHENNLQVPCFEFHHIIFKNVGICAICYFFSNFKFTFSPQILSFFHYITEFLNFHKSLIFFGLILFYIPILRAPPGIILLNN